ncbi:MAG: YgiT-type zinc finger protein [Nitrospira sp.]|nr:YgiT-type zinc finger protein [Nitrospira sp.]
MNFRWGEELKIIEQVPAEVCEQCGEKYFQTQV